MTYTAPELALDTAARLMAGMDGPTREDAAAVVGAITPLIAQDVAQMVGTALEAIEQHDPSCLSLYGDDPCDCSWATIATVIRQVRDKVGIVA